MKFKKYLIFINLKIYENMDDVNEMVEIVGRSGCLMSAVEIPGVNPNFSEIRSYFK